MKPTDIMSAARGEVLPAIVNLRTGKKIPFGKRHNTLSYMSSEAMAAAFGGDPSYIPAKMGFIYGTESSIADQGIGRDQDWDRLPQEFQDWTGGQGTVDVQVVDFSYAPSLGMAPEEGSSSSDSDPEGSSVRNAITFHAMSNSADSGAFGGSVFTGGAGSDGMYLYQALLLGERGGRYYILARVSLKDGDSYLQKPAGFEIALDWTVIFK